jgi:IS5 family transposase
MILKVVEIEQLPLRQSYTKPLKRLSVNQRFSNHPRNKSKARKADRKVKIIAGQLERNLPANS